MKYLTRNQIVERAMEIYDIQSKDISKASAAKTISKLASTYPKNSEKKYADQALKKGNEYYYPERVALYLIYLGEPYFSKLSSDPEVRETRLIQHCKNRALEEKELCSTPGDFHLNKRALLEKNKKDILLKLEEKTGLTISEIEHACKDAVWYKQRDLSMLIDFANCELTNVKIPPIISDGELDMFYEDTEWELTLEYFDDWSDFPFITGCSRRRFSDFEKLDNKELEYKLKAVFELFFEPFNSHDLYLDMERVSDTNPEHHDEEYFITYQKMIRYKTYCKLKDTPLNKFLLNQDSFEEMQKKFVDKIVKEITEKAVKKITRQVLEEINRQKDIIQIR